MPKKQTKEYLKLLRSPAERDRWLALLREAERLLGQRTPIFLCQEVEELRHVMAAALEEKLGPSDPIKHPWGHKALNPLGGYSEVPAGQTDTAVARKLRTDAAIIAREEFVAELLSDLGAEPEGEEP